MDNEYHKINIQQSLPISNQDYAKVMNRIYTKNNSVYDSWIAETRNLFRKALQTLVENDYIDFVLPGSNNIAEFTELFIEELAKSGFAVSYPYKKPNGQRILKRYYKCHEQLQLDKTYRLRNPETDELDTMHIRIRMSFT